MIKKKLSIIIPVYNEEKTIITTIKKIKETKDDRVDYEVIVINDGSKDNTLELLKSNINLDYHLIDGKENLGKGHAVRKGLEHSTGDYIIFQDGDLEYNPAEFSKFINIMLKFDADAVIGSRFNYDEYTRSYNILNKLANHFITFFFNILYNTAFTDIYCCYLCFKKELLVSQTLKTDGFDQHAEILCKIIKKGKNFYEVPTNYIGRTKEEGKKIRFYHILPVLFRIALERIKQ